MYTYFGHKLILGVLQMNFQVCRDVFSVELLPCISDQLAEEQQKNPDLFAWSLAHAPSLLGTQIMSN